ncbi:assimilatory sulfite reductase (NADPH) flavoprotein subunit [Staphylococcus succinus]|uniref:assimilatory sulfite reductase (NADPH) flavoprotein subunit n=1 Tax=Staphylococcus succinus TaxID=61015 RepID=UPI001F5476E4|nr:assimilatory sulfite reductase (NADPH) flavoprotein subunit [Staphylococcus succinus]
MTALELNEKNTPFDQTQLGLINQLLPTLTTNQQHWLSSYLLHSDDQDTTITPTSSNISETDASAKASGTHSDEPLEINILFGTETGNAEEIADQFEATLKSHHFNVHLWDMDDFPQNELPNTTYLFIICSTQGVGEPPINAIDFHEFLHSDQAPMLTHLKFSVLALGDQDFPDFCQAGKEFDEILGKLGGQRLADRVDCDFDYEDAAEKWMTDMVNLLSQNAPNDSAIDDSVESHVAIETSDEAYSKVNPFHAEVLVNAVLTDLNATREVRHLELSLEGYNESYEPGDSLVIIPENHPSLVEHVLETLRWQPDTIIHIGKDAQPWTVRAALTHYFEISKLTPSLVNQAAELFRNPMLNANVQKSDWVQSYIDGRDFIDLIKDFSPVSLEPHMLNQLLRKLPPREYSIASSNQVNPHSVHITVRVVRYESHHRERLGVCSVQLAERVKTGDTVPVFIKKNAHFKFPYDEATPVIMIGAGTGIAPYRAYLQQRAQLGLKGAQWLIFGNQNYYADYLYQSDLETWLNDGVLSKLDLAFSRDTDNKIYVQHRIEENGAEFYRWLSQGATIYLCGDKDEMAKGVHNALINVLTHHGNYDEIEAEHYLSDLIKNQRYLRDVY